MVKIGDVYWINAENQIPHPHIIIDVQASNHYIVVCAVTTNMKKISMLGNILLDMGEANLPKQSIIEVSKIQTIQESQLGDYIGTLSADRTNQIHAGIRFTQTSYFRR